MTVRRITRRIRQRRARLNTGRLAEILQSISELDATVAKSQFDRAGLVLEAEGLLKAAEEERYQHDTETGPYEVAIEAPASRGTTTIDPAAFRKLVSDTEFMQCVTIPVGEAKKVLNQKQLAKVADFKEGKAKDPVTVVRPVK